MVIANPAEPLQCTVLNAPRPAHKTLARWLLLLVVLLGAGLRVANLPGHQDVRDVDEQAYLFSSLNLLEGMVPAMKATPSGPQTWLGWAYAGATATKNFLQPTPQELQRPAKVRPFYAVNRALFDLYHDGGTFRHFELCIFILVELWAAVAAFRLGRERGGIWVGLLGGGLAAVLPMFVDFSGMLRPYSIGWAFGLLAFCTAATGDNPKRWRWAAILMGLAVASRVEMIVAIPVLWWLCWERPQPQIPLRRMIWSTTWVCFVATFIAAPWLFTSLVGNIRTILTVGFAAADTIHSHGTPPIPAFLWEQGLCLSLLLFAAGILLVPAKQRLKRIVFAGLVGFLMLACSKDDGYGIRHQGVAVVVYIFATILAAATVYARWPRITRVVITLVVLLPLVMAVRLVAQNRANNFDDASLTWIETHIKPGSALYLSPGSTPMRLPLPTAAAAERLWGEVQSSTAWAQKLRSGLERFHIGNISDTELPRALSEDNLCTERSNRRSWFILASAVDTTTPRFDIHLYNNSPVFGLHGLNELQTEFAKTGGVYLGAAPVELPNTKHIQLLSASGQREFDIYYTEDALLPPVPPNP